MGCRRACGWGAKIGQKKREIQGGRGEGEEEEEEEEELWVEEDEADADEGMEGLD